MDILIKKGRVIDPKQKLDRVVDVLISDGVIKKFAPSIKDACDVVIDGTDCIVAPGFIDMHTHLRDPGFEYKEDIISGANAALRGGFTSIVCMANTNPVADNPETISYIVEKAKNTPINIYPVGAMTKGMKGKEMCDFRELHSAGAIAVSDDGVPVKNPKMMLDVIRTANAQKILAIAHCEDTDLADGGVVNAGSISQQLKVRDISSISEYMAIMRDVMLAASNKSRLHIAHVSTKESVRVIRWAKKQNPKITCETAPHYVYLTDSAVMSFGVDAKMNPPLRKDEDVEAVIEGLRDGTIDVLATDHAPHSKEDKGTITNGAFGIVGLETALAVSYTSLVAAGKMSIRKLIRLMSTNPAKILGIDAGSLAVGKPADIVIFDTNEQTIDKSAFASKSQNTPFDGMTLRGRVRYTIAKGKIAYDSGIR